MQAGFLSGTWLQATPWDADLFYQSSFKDRTDLPIKDASSLIHFWQYFQVCRFLNSPTKRPSYSRTQTPFWGPLSLQHDTKAPYLLDLRNAILLFSCKSSTVCKAGDRELMVNLSKEDWVKINLLTHMGSLSVSVQKHGYKLGYRWYRAQPV